MSSTPDPTRKLFLAKLFGAGIAAGTAPVTLLQEGAAPGAAPAATAAPFNLIRPETRAVARRDGQA